MTRDEKYQNFKDISQFIDNESNLILPNEKHLGFIVGSINDIIKPNRDVAVILPENIQTLTLVYKCFSLLPKINSPNLKSIHLCEYFRFYEFTKLKEKIPPTVTNLTLIDCCPLTMDIDELPNNIKTLTIVEKGHFIIKKIPDTIDFIIYSPLSIWTLLSEVICTIKIAKYLANKLLVINNTKTRVDVVVLD